MPTPSGSAIVGWILAISLLVVATTDAGRGGNERRPERLSLSPTAYVRNGTMMFAFG